MKSVNRLLSIILAAALAFGMILPASAATRETVSGECGEHLTWALDMSSGELTVSGTGEMYDYTNSDNTAPWRAYTNLVRSAAIKSGVTSIGESAFYECWALESVSLPSSLTYIGYESFARCYSLTSVTIPSGVRVIDSRAFASCSALNSVTLPSSLTELGDRAFSYCTALESVTVPSGITALNTAVFNCCHALREVSLPTGLKTIDSYAFFECRALLEITIPENVKTLGSQAFERCSALNKMTFRGNKPTSVGQHVFDDTRDDLVILYRTQNASNWAPSGQQYWEGVPIAPVGTTLDRPTYSGNYFGFAWSLATSTGALTVSGTGSIAEAAGDEPLPWNSYKAYITSVTVGSGVTELKQGFCSEAYALREVTLPASLTSIAPFAFRYCMTLTEVALPAGIEAIGSYAFDRCGALKSIDIPDGVTEIGMDAFVECKSLKTIVIPDGVTELHYVFLNCFALKEAQLGAGLETIGDYAFSGCYALSGIDIPEGVAVISDCAFYECWSLTSVVLPASLVSLGTGAFRECPYLASATFEGEPPASYGLELFIRAAEGFTIYYYSTYAESWAPNGEDTWQGYPIEMIDGPSAPSGDVNCDGIVNTTDALLVLRYVLGSAELADFSAADVNGDGSVTTGDALMILRTVLGLA